MLFNVTMAQSERAWLTTFAERSFGFLLFLLLSFLGARQISSAVQESQTLDEALHLAAGYSYWTTGDFRLNPEHPPLAKLLAALPLLALQPSFSPPAHAWQDADAYAIGGEFLYNNHISADRLLLAGRLTVVLL